MGTKKVRTNSGHDAGPAGGRWMPRAEVKDSAKSRRRGEDKKEVQKGLKDKKVEEANVIRRSKMPRGFQPVGEREMNGGTWEPGTSPQDILCPTCGEPWDKASPAGRNIMMGRTDDCPVCMPLAHPVGEACSGTGAIAMPVGFAAPRKPKKLINDKTKKEESFEERVDRVLSEESIPAPAPQPLPKLPAHESWEPGRDFVDFIDEGIDPATMAGLANNVSVASPGSNSLGPNSRLKKLTAAVGATKNKAQADVRAKKDMKDLEDEVEEIKDKQAGR